MGPGNQGMRRLMRQRAFCHNPEILKNGGRVGLDADFFFIPVPDYVPS